MFGWALPRRPGAAPPTNAFWAWLTRIARVEARSDTSTRWPAADPRSRALSDGEDSDGALEPGDDVGDRDADLRRAAAVLVAARR